MEILCVNGPRVMATFYECLIAAAVILDNRGSKLSKGQFGQGPGTIYHCQVGLAFRRVLFDRDPS